MGSVDNFRTNVFKDSTVYGFKKAFDFYPFLSTERVDLKILFTWNPRDLSAHDLHSDGRSQIIHGLITIKHKSVAK